MARKRDSVEAGRAGNHGRVALTPVTVDFNGGGEVVVGMSFFRVLREFESISVYM